ncbi:hypothetical protein SADUNF_Sadunf16G0116500 [Salix dunnii]|uniref:Uncharacterized protein n=1 Tax=Salix dunnii TaxID=1413687 RepID=A0A835JB56_9ROSI|nr:hypothetical protein SADUNF_Sadunf16G0116500 [Salix dunnii]
MASVSLGFEQLFLVLLKCGQEPPSKAQFISFFFYTSRHSLATVYDGLSLQVASEHPLRAVNILLRECFHHHVFQAPHEFGFRLKGDAESSFCKRQSLGSRFIFPDKPSI